MTITPIANGLRVSLHGPIQLSASHIEHELQTLLTAAPKYVELDLAEVDFVTSVGLSVLINFRNNLNAAGGALHTVAIQEKVLGTVRHAHLQDLFNITPDTKIIKTP